MGLILRALGSFVGERARTPNSGSAQKLLLSPKTAALAAVFLSPGMPA
jgi:hypothetical protein